MTRLAEKMLKQTQHDMQVSGNSGTQRELAVMCGDPGPVSFQATTVGGTCLFQNYGDCKISVLFNVFDGLILGQMLGSFTRMLFFPSFARISSIFQINTKFPLPFKIIGFSGRISHKLEILLKYHYVNTTTKTYRYLILLAENFSNVTCGMELTKISNNMLFILNIPIIIQRFPYTEYPVCFPRLRIDLIFTEVAKFVNYQFMLICSLKSFIMLILNLYTSGMYSILSGGMNMIDILRLYHQLVAKSPSFSVPPNIIYQAPIVLMCAAHNKTEVENVEENYDDSNLLHHSSTNQQNVLSVNPSVVNGKRNRTQDPRDYLKRSSVLHSEQKDNSMKPISTESNSKVVVSGYNTDDYTTSQTSFTTISSCGPVSSSSFLLNSTGSTVFKNKSKKPTNFYHAPTPVKRHTSSQKLCELQAEFLESVQYSSSIDSTLSSRYGSLDTCSVAMDNVNNNSKRNIRNEPWNSRES